MILHSPEFQLTVLVRVPFSCDTWIKKLLQRTVSDAMEMCCSFEWWICSILRPCQYSSRRMTGNALLLISVCLSVVCLSLKPPPDSIHALSTPLCLSSCPARINSVSSPLWCHQKGEMKTWAAQLTRVGVCLCVLVHLHAWKVYPVKLGHAHSIWISHRWGVLLYRRQNKVMLFWRFWSNMKLLRQASEKGAWESFWSWRRR